MACTYKYDIRNPADHEIPLGEMIDKSGYE